MNDYIIMNDFENWLRSKHTAIGKHSEILVWCYDKDNHTVSRNCLVYDGHFENAFTRFFIERNE